MADEFNLVPTNNLEKHLDNILRTAQGEEPQYDLAPNWRVEQYLAAIASALASGGGGSGGGGVKFVDEVDLRWGDNDPDAAQKVYDDLQNYSNYSFIGWYSILGHSMCPLFRESSTKIMAYVTEMMAPTKLQYTEYLFTWNSTTKKFGQSATTKYYTMTPD